MGTMNMIRLSVVSVLIALWPLQGVCAERSVHLATLNWEPYIGEHLEGYGFGAEILRTAFHKAGYEVTFSFMPWVRTLKDVEIGKYDAVCFAYHSVERSKKYIFTKSFAQSVLGFGKLRDSYIPFETLQDLVPYRIGVVRGFVNTPEFDTMKILKKEEAKNELLNLKKLIYRRVDLIVIDEFVMLNLIKKHYPGKTNVVEFLDPPLITQPLHLMFSKKIEDSPIKVHAFNQAIAEMQKDGTIKIIMKNYGYDHTH